MCPLPSRSLLLLLILKRTHNVSCEFSSIADKILLVKDVTRINLRAPLFLVHHYGDGERGENLLASIVYGIAITVLQGIACLLVSFRIPPAFRRVQVAILSEASCVCAHCMLGY
ncbi:hypothetical protein PILCRDRAFT_816511 [Piloderma croceum F 1598]|uniref:Uncharacterized protein n=1 Tax=Piloderma croceum (strain F 1598) TaxID=765440 RepID=A0A0C3G5N8_PILCF|nr:hypothetical protein PILCRDRAFT_816511 [Piloderma croceum F 1598]